MPPGYRSKFSNSVISCALRKLHVSVICSKFGDKEPRQSQSSSLLSTDVNPLVLRSHSFQVRLNQMPLAIWLQL